MNRGDIVKITGKIATCAAFAAVGFIAGTAVDNRPEVEQVSALEQQVHELKMGWAECVLEATDPKKPLCPKTTSGSNDAYSIPQWVDSLPREERLEWLQHEIAYQENNKAIIHRAIARRSQAICGSDHCL